MRLNRKAATKDHWSADNSKRGVTRLRAYFAAFLAFGGTVLLIVALLQGTFENTRYFGSIAFAENPVGFVIWAIVWVIGISFFSWVFLIFRDQSRR